MQLDTQRGTRYPMQFTGSGWQYFKIWIVNILLTIITVYIYSAWAKVRTKRYFYGNTVLDNSTFEYHAKGLQILLGRIIALILLILVTLSGVFPLVSIGATILIFVLLPWALWRSLKFNARMSSFRNVRFGYTGKVLPIYGIVLFLPFLPILVFGAIAALVYFTVNPELAPTIAIVGIFATYAFVPWIHKVTQNHIINRYRYGTSGFSTKLSKRSFYAAYILGFLIWVLMMVLAIAVIALIAMATGIISEDTMAQFQGMLDESGEAPPAGLWVLGILVYLLLFVAGFLASAFLRAKIRKHTFERSVIDGRINLESTVSTWPLFWIMLSNAFLVIITLGLGYPWTKVRTARYMANNTALYCEDTLDNFINAEKEKISALGEEFGDAFDMDMDMGF